MQAISDALRCRIHVLKWAPPHSVFIAAQICPRSFLDAASWAGISRSAGKPSEAELHVPARTLWLSLHGEAHFRSLHAVSTILS